MANDLRERLTIVNGADEIVGAAEQDEVWRRGLLHRAARLIITNPNGDVLVWRRHGHEILYPNCLDISVARPVGEGYDYEDAARQGIKDAIGVDGLELHYVGKRREALQVVTAAPPVHEALLNTFGMFYHAVFDEAPTALAPGGAGSAAWWRPGRVHRFALEKPQGVTDGLAHSVIFFSQIGL